MDKLSSTVEMMESDDYKQRFIAEYLQLKIRHEKLHKMLIKLTAGTLDFEPSSDVHLLFEQAALMNRYLDILELRAQMEQIELPE